MSAEDVEKFIVFPEERKNQLPVIFAQFRVLGSVRLLVHRQPSGFPDVDGAAGGEREHVA